MIILCHGSGQNGHEGKRSGVRWSHQFLVGLASLEVNKRFFCGHIRPRGACMCWALFRMPVTW